jgi:hypothetical protein
MLVKQLADKVNTPGDTPVEDRVDEVAVHDIRLGTTLGLAAMATHTGVDYSIQPRGFQGGAPEDIDEKSPWSASMATAMPLPNSPIPSLC